jgi:hypothetical protein
MSGRWARVRRAVVLAVMMGAMVSCANGSDGDDPGGDAVGEQGASGVTILRAVEATGEVESARVELQTTYTGLGAMRDAPPGVDAVRMVQRAAFDRAAGRAEAESDMSELAAVLQGTDETVPGDYTLPTRFVIDGETVYAQIGPMARAVGLDPSSWIRRDLAGFAAQSIDNETAALLLDPLGMLTLLARPVSDVRSAGGDEVRGVAATHLTATVDLRASAGSSGGAAGTNGSSHGGSGGAGSGDDVVDARFRSVGVDELPVGVWIGADGVVRRLEFALDAGSGTRSGPGGLVTTFDVYDVGESLDIALPDPATVVDQADLQPRGDE